MKITTLIIAVLMLASVPAAAQMYGDGMMRGGRHGGGMYQQGTNDGYGQNMPGYGQNRPGYGSQGWQSQMSRNLTPEQRKTVNRLTSEYSDVVTPMYAKLNRAMNDLQWALDEEKPDRTRVMELARTVAEVRGELFEKRIDLRLQWIEHGLPAESYMMGQGMMMGPGMMGRGMMGPGMMGRGMMGPGMMGPGMMW